MWFLLLPFDMEVLRSNSTRHLHWIGRLGWIGSDHLSRVSPCHPCHPSIHLRLHNSLPALGRSYPTLHCHASLNSTFSLAQFVCSFVPSPSPSPSCMQSEANSLHINLPHPQASLPFPLPFSINTLTFVHQPHLSVCTSPVLKTSINIQPTFVTATYSRSPQTKQQPSK